MRAAALLLALTLITSCFVGGTFAKYVSEATATDTARVARWEFDLNGVDIAKSTVNEFTFDVFKTAEVKDSNGSAETDVKTGTGSETIIAPGTRGSVSVELVNESEVNAKYSVVFSATEAGVPLLWSTTGADGTWEDDVTALNVPETAIGMTDGSATITLHWMWAFGSSDAVDDSTNVDDTALGTAATLAQPSVTAKVTVIQVD